MLYPLKFKPHYIETSWGSDYLAKAGLKSVRGKNISKLGENVVLSSLKGKVSVVCDGFLKSNGIDELVEVYMGDLVGEHVFSSWGIDFPLELKFVFTDRNMPLQVCPDDMAALNYGGRGKDKLWYVAEAHQGACIYLGFNKSLTHAEYDRAIDEGRLAEYLNKIEVKKGDVFYVPSATVHAVGAGVVISEVGDSSHLSYVIQNWDDVPNDSCLQFDRADEVVNLNELYSHDLNLNRGIAANECAGLVKSTHFAVNLISLAGKMNRDFVATDSFVAYMVVEGQVEIDCEGDSASADRFETVLLPAESCDVLLCGQGRLLEITML